MTKTYDTIIIGGGIAGLYTAYKLQKKDPQQSILILEKEAVLGGRVDTYTDKYMTVEAGAGRFHENQKHIMKLIKELNLQNKMKKTSSNAISIINGTYLTSIMDAPSDKSDKSDKSIQSIQSVKTTFDAALNLYLGQDTIPNAGLIAKVILASKFEEKETLINQSFLHYAKQFLTPEEIQFIKDTFGYYSELVIMNAYDAINLMEKHLTPTNQYYILQGGLSQMIDALETEITKKSHKNPVKIIRNQEVKSIQEDIKQRDAKHQDEHIFEIKTKETTTKTETIYYTITCICALPKHALDTIRTPLTQSIKPLLNKINCSPLCRIYSKFATATPITSITQTTNPVPETNQTKTKDDKIWFQDLPKLTTNNNLRMVIPIDPKTGIIMISYTDNKYAEFWKNIYTKRGEQGINEELKKLIKETLEIEMPDPIKTNIFYWSCGVGYWGIGADSEEIANKITKPNDQYEFYVCGEHYSNTDQQWIEGALETAERVLNKTNKTNKNKK